jgi:hypothetical protein
MKIEFSREMLEQLIQYQNARIVALERKVKEQMVEMNSLILDLGELQNTENYE